MEHSELRRLKSTMIRFENVFNEKCTIENVGSKMPFIFGDDIGIIDKGEDGIIRYYGRFVRYEENTPNPFAPKQGFNESSPYGTYAVIRLWEDEVEEAEEPYLSSTESRFFIDEHSQFSLVHSHRR